MTNALNKKFFSYVIPSILAFALSGVYTIVDGFFIGQSLGDAGLTAITLGYPISALVGAIGTGLGLSGAIRFTILNAQGAAKKRQECFSGTTLLMLLTAGLLTAILLAFARPILHLLGARGNMVDLCAEYARVIALGAAFQLLATGFVPFIRNMGGATVAMIAMILGFAANIVLDYAFVWVLNWGMAGAAWATIIGQAVTMIVAVIFFVVKKSSFCLPKLRELCGLWKNVLIVAISPFGLTFSSIITMLLINRFLLLYGDEQAVAIYGCIGYVIAILYLLLQGVGDGSQPLISHYYGEDDRNSVKTSLRLAYLTAAVVTAACMIGVYLTRAKVGILFGASPEANAGVIQYLPLFLAPLLFLAFVRITTSYFYATEKNGLSYLLVYAEPVCTLLMLLLLPPMLKLTGVWLATPIAQVITFVIALAAKRRVDAKIYRCPSQAQNGG